MKDQADKVSSPSPGTGVSAFEDAYRRYVQNLQEAQTDLAKRLQNEHQRYMMRLSEPQLELQRSWSEAEQEYARSIRELAGQSEGDHEKVREAHASATQTAQKLQAKFQEDMTQVHQEFAQMQQQACEEAQSRSDAALRDYVRALKSAWEQVDPEAFDPRLVALVGQSMLAVALPATARSGV